MKDARSCRMLYFLPDWEDRIDPNFDFHKDFGRFRSEDAYASSVYAHEIFPEPPYDGILVSLAIFGDKISLNHDGTTFTIRGFQSIKDYLRVERASKSLLVMGDCGAFSYVNEEKPPPEAAPKRIAELYHHLGFDLGVSPDHVIVNSIVVRNGDRLEKHELTVREKEQRRQISLRNAEKFLVHVQRKSLCFTPIGAAQGYDIKTFVDSVNQLIDMGYDYIAIGGLVRYPTPYVAEIVEAVAAQVRRRRRKIRIHLLGILRLSLLDRFRELGIASFDSASFMRKAWLRSGMNYFGVDGGWYAAIRVPPSYDPRVQAMAQRKQISAAKLSRLEKDAMRALDDYERKRISLEATLAAVLEYDRLLERNSEDFGKFYDAYHRTLQSRIWERCYCSICREAGIHVVIFRGTNRNKRRGLHNTKLFYDLYIRKGDKSD